MLKVQHTIRILERKMRSIPGNMANSDLPLLPSAENENIPVNIISSSSMKRKMKMTSLIAFAFVMGLLVFAHEMGHFLVAKKSGMAVPTFSIGFGPKIWGFTYRETFFKVSAIPFGGYVEVLGEKPGEAVPPEMEHKTFRSKSPAVKFIFAFAGPAFNAIFAFLLFMGIFMKGAPMISSKIGNVAPESPAARANLLPGDIISGVNGENVSTWYQINRIFGSNKNGNAIRLEINRDGNLYATTIVPERGEVVNEFGEIVTGWKIGIFHADEKGLLKIGFIGAARESVIRCRYVVVIVGASIKRLVLRKMPIESLGGPMKIASVAGDAARAGFLSLLSIAAILSINMAVFNFLPIPVLDGGHLLFSIIEAFRGRPLGLSAYRFLNVIGASFLVILTVTVIYNDMVSFVKSKSVKQPVSQSISAPEKESNEIGASD